MVSPTCTKTETRNPFLSTPPTPLIARFHHAAAHLCKMLNMIGTQEQCKTLSSRNKIPRCYITCVRSFCFALSRRMKNITLAFLRFTRPKALYGVFCSTSGICCRGYSGLPSVKRFPDSWKHVVSPHVQCNRRSPPMFDRHALLQPCLGRGARRVRPKPGGGLLLASAGSTMEKAASST